MPYSNYSLDINVFIFFNQYGDFPFFHLQIESHCLSSFSFFKMLPLDQK